MTRLFSGCFKYLLFVMGGLAFLTLLFARPENYFGLVVIVAACGGTLFFYYTPSK